MRRLFFVFLFLTCVAPLSATSRYDRWILDYSVLHGIEPRWSKAVAMAESALRADVTSWAGAEGLYQFMPATWGGFAPEPWKSLGPFEPEAAIFVGCKYLRWCYDRTPNAERRQRKALANASYNSGWGNVIKARAKCRESILPCVECNPEVWDSPNVEDYLVTCPSCREETRGYVQRIRRFETQLLAKGEFF